ncbi:MAG: hypothetical protein V3U72_00685, partial [Candidatus Aenigmarchaeota archaeon]
MGFFDFLRGKEEEAPEQLQDMGSVELGSVKETVEKSISEKLSMERERVKELYAKIREDFREIKKLNNELSGKAFKSGQRMDAPVNMVKDNYVRKTISLLNNVPAVSNFEHKEIMDFCSGTGKILKGMQKLPPKQTILLSKYFKSEALKIIKTLKNIENRRKEMESLLKGKALWFEGEINSRIDRIFELIKRSKDLEMQENMLREKIKTKKSEKKEKERELNEFLSGDDYKGFESLGSEVKGLEKERSEIENEIREEMSGIKRPLKKLEYTVKHDERISREKRSLFSRISHSPVKILFQDQGDSILMEALAKLRELRLKDNEKERVEGLIK